MGQITLTQLKIGLALLLPWGCIIDDCQGAVKVRVDDRPDLNVELPVIIRAAERNDCRGDDFLILLAIRLSENGGPGREFGVMHPRAIDTDLDTQAGWAAATIIKNRKRYEEDGYTYDFITFLGNRYCPAEVDPEGNTNWKKNVQYWFEKFKGK